MFKNTLKRLGAIVMVLALAMSVMAVSAFATEGEPEAITSLSFTKEVTTDGKTYAPATKFEFQVSPATVSTGETYQNMPVSAGIEGGVTVTDPDSFTPGENATVSNKYTANGSLNFDAAKFSAPGIYKYTVQEKTGSYDGVTYDTTARTLYVYVRNSSTDGYEVYGAVLVKTVTNAEGETTSTKNDPFVNDYGATNGKIHTLTITKELAGNQAYSGDTFTFTVKIDGATGEKYLVNLPDNKTVTLISGTEQTISLKGGETATVNGLSEGDKFSVSEVANDKGYTASYKLNDATVETINQVATGAKDNTVVVTNTKEVSVSTGVIMNIAPYALMLVLAGGIAVFFLRRRNAE